VQEIVRFSVATRRLTQDTWVVAVTGDLDLYNAPALKEELLGLPDSVTRVVVDLAGVPFLDSAGLSVLTTIARRFRYAGGGVALAGADRNIQRVLSLTGLDRYFDVHATVADAVAHALAA
jgi:anti-sigma B factor antagonist